MFELFETFPVMWCVVTGPCELTYQRGQSEEKYCAGCRFERSQELLGPPETLRENLNKLILKGREPPLRKVTATAGGNTKVKERDKKGTLKQPSPLEKIMRIRERHICKNTFSQQTKFFTEHSVHQKNTHQSSERTTWILNTISMSLCHVLRKHEVSCVTFYRWMYYRQWGCKMSLYKENISLTFCFKNMQCLQAPTGKKATFTPVQSPSKFRRFRVRGLCSTVPQVGQLTDVLHASVELEPCQT